jgi:hypothetical protein
LKSKGAGTGGAGAKHARFNTGIGTHSGDEEDHMIYGYSGRLIHRFGGKNDILDKSRFQKIALRLAGYHDDQVDWDFCVDIPAYAGKPARTEEVKASSYDAVYGELIEPYLTSESSWKLFVRRRSLDRELSDGELKLSAAEHNIVQLHRKNVGTAYFKVPQSISNDQVSYGINQIQKVFFPALRLLFRERPLCRITIDGISLGYGGFEITKPLWEHIRGDWKEDKRVFEVGEGSEHSEMGYVRLIGSPDMMEYESKEFKRIESEIRNRIEPIAPGYRIWESPESREREGRSIHIDLEGTQRAVVHDLENFFDKPGFVSIAPFRPEWKTFEIEETVRSGTPRSKGWKPRHGEGTLEGFRDILRQLIEDSSIDHFKVILQEARNPSNDGRMFSIDGSTTEDEWRVNVFDWLRTSKLRVTPGRSLSFRK